MNQFFHRWTVGLLLSSAATTVVAAPLYQPAVQVGTVTTPLIDEASGLAASKLNAGVLWTHNDSGDTARMFALTTTGNLLGTFNFTLPVGVTAFDWEDMAVGPGPVPGTSYLYAGDIGDNNLVRSSVKVYRAAEPVVDAGATTPVTATLNDVETLTLVYPNDINDIPIRRNAETLIIDPLSGDLYIVTKTFGGEEVYRAAAPLSNSGTITLELLNTISLVRATGGSIAPDGSAVIVRNLLGAVQFNRPVGGTLADAFASTPIPVTLALEEQGEALGFAAGTSNNGFFTLSEGEDQPLYFYAPVPEPVAAGPLLLCALLARRRNRALNYRESNAALPVSNRFLN